MGDPFAPLVGRPIPPRPAYIGPEGAPPGVRVDFAAYKGVNGRPWYADRPLIKPHLAVVHTNGAGGEGSLQSSINWSNGGLYTRTHAHYNINAPVPTKHCPTNRRGIGNSTLRELELRYGVKDSSFWSIVIETADRGYLNGGGVDLGPFLYDHAELIARILAYESIWAQFPLELPPEWHKPGVACHVWPYPYPHYTTVRGKTCPGTTKIEQFKRVILPRAREIRDAWVGVVVTPPPPPPPPAIDPTTPRSVMLGNLTLSPHRFIDDRPTAPVPYPGNADQTPEFYEARKGLRKAGTHALLCADPKRASGVRLTVTLAGATTGGYVVVNGTTVGLVEQAGRQNLFTFDAPIDEMGFAHIKVVGVSSFYLIMDRVGHYEKV